MWILGDIPPGWPFRRALRLPHPEEPHIEGATLANVNVAELMNRWYIDWRVPVEHWEYWHTAIVITPRSDIPTCWTWEDEWGRRHLDVNPVCLTQGVIAHEQSHNSYDLLTEEQKDDFEHAFAAVQNDRYMRLLYSKKPEMMGEIDDAGRHVEAHAEGYRYLGGRMPQALKAFYPRLLA